MKTQKRIAMMSIMVVFTLTSVILANCDNGATLGGNTNQNPIATDFNISGTGTFTYDGNQKTVTVTAKAGKTSGVVTVKYNGNTIAPSAVGTYTVTFDVAAATGWNAASGLSAGTLIINAANLNNQNPIATDFNVSGTGTFTYDGNQKTVTVTAKAGKTSGVVTVKYNGNTIAPSAVGTYTVTFDVAAATGWNNATDLSAGNLTIINQTPVAGDYNFSNLIQKAGIVTEVTIIANSGKSPGTVINIRYDDSTEIPQTVGTYAITFDVAAAEGWNAASDLSAGNLAVIYNYNIGDTGPAGGKIFYYSETGFTMTDTGETCHYLEAAPINLVTSLKWTNRTGNTTIQVNSPYLNVTGTGTDIGTGRRNTARILAVENNAPAAQFCNNYEHNGFTDWFLPSRYELNQLYINREAVNGLGTGTYWSSSQSRHSASSSYAYAINFSEGNNTLESGKSSSGLVCAVRAF